MVTFSVDEVGPGELRFRKTTLGKCYPDALFVGGDLETPIVHVHDTHPLLGAVGLAFALHLPVVLSPDAIWLTIAQGVSRHIQLNAERLRPQLVRHAGTRELRVSTLSLETTTDVQTIVAEFRDVLAAEIGDGRARLFECDFSTSTDVDRLASQIVLLDSYAPYFSYVLSIICGIPRITLTGTVEDWRKIRERIEVVAELDLDQWCASLRPILDQFVRAAEGSPDIAFWKRIYNPRDNYGGDIITGWISRFYPYLKRANDPWRPNPMLALPVGEPRNSTIKEGYRGEVGYRGPGIEASDVPFVASRVDVRTERRLGGQIERGWLALVGGLAAVAYDADGALRPIAGWHLTTGGPRIEDVVERIAGGPTVIAASKPAPPEPPAPRSFLARLFRRPVPRAWGRPRLQGPGEVIALYESIERATLFTDDRTWRLRPVSEHFRIRCGQDHGTCIADLPGDRRLCYRLQGETASYFVCTIDGEPPKRPDAKPWEMSVVSPMGGVDDWEWLGTSLAGILQTALDTNGQWFPITRSRS